MSKSTRKSQTNVGLTVAKSSFSGVALTVLAVTATSPAGLGSMIGISTAGTLGGHSRETDEYNLFPTAAAPLTEVEMRGIQNQLADTTASLDAVRASTDAEIEKMRALAIRHHATHRLADNDAPAVDMASYTPPGFESCTAALAFLLSGRA